jgi:hypothetical protein
MDLSPEPNLTIHPLAKIFPPLEKDELQNLAADIKENGLLHPILVDEQNRIVDGRNRLEACKIAEVEPRTETIGGDAAKRIIAENILRRHLSKGQQAMAFAKVYPEPEKGGRGKRSDIPDGFGTGKGHWRNLLSQARTVLRFSRDLAADVMADKISLDEAYDTTKSVGTKEANGHAQTNGGIPARTRRVPPKHKNRGEGSRPLDNNLEGSNGNVYRGGNGGIEYYTPSKYVEAARQVMGAIDLDPASCEAAQQVVKATDYFTMDDDGLAQVWNGRVWLNPPYHRDLLSLFVDILLFELKAGRVSSAIMLTNNSTEAQWFHRAQQASAAICFTYGRIQFIGPSDDKTSAPLQGQTFFYFGPDRNRFADVFCKFDFVVTTARNYKESIDSAPEPYGARL